MLFTSGFSLCTFVSFVAMRKWELTAKHPFCTKLNINIPEQISGTHTQPDTTCRCQQHHRFVCTVPYKGDSTLHPSKQHVRQQSGSRFTSLASSKAKGSSPAPSCHHYSLVMPHQCVCKNRVSLQHGQLPLQVPLSEEPQGENTTISEGKERCRLPGAFSTPSLNPESAPQEGQREAPPTALLLVSLPRGSCAPQLSGQ